MSDVSSFIVLLCSIKAIYCILSVLDALNGFVKKKLHAVIYDDWVPLKSIHSRSKIECQCDEIHEKTNWQLKSIEFKTILFLVPAENGEEISIITGWKVSIIWRIGTPHMRVSSFRRICFSHFIWFPSVVRMNHFCLK